jgi:hypothetical protein
MKQLILNFFKQHFPAILIFIVLAFAYFIPVLSGKKIVQYDIIQSKCMQGEINRYLEKGEYILWVNNMFSGMPKFQLTYHSFNNLIGLLLELYRAIFIEPTHYLILGMIGVYIFCITLQINRWIAVIAAIAFAFSSFNIISLEAGHTSKVSGMALMGPLLAGIIMTYRGKMIPGFLLTAFFAMLQVRTNHVQITYYAVIVAAILVFFELYRHIVQKDILSFAKKTGLLTCAALLALAANTSLLWPTYEYSKQTIRGGASELKSKAEQKKGGGLDRDYAFNWSQGISESLTFIVPGYVGGSSTETFDESSNLYKALTSKGVNDVQAKKAINKIPSYWGNQPFTSGPLYLGASVVFLFLFGFLISKNRLKWAMLSCAVLALLLIWGKNFSTLSYFFFDYVPLYNKFRSPSMMFSIIMLMAPVMAAMGLNELLSASLDRQFLLRNLKIAGGVTLGLCVLILLSSSMLSFSPDEKLNNSEKQFYDAYKKAEKIPGFADEMLKALKADRKAMLQSDALRSALFIAMAALLIYLFIEKKIKFELTAALLAALVLVDLWQVDKRYLNNSKFIAASEYQKNFLPRAVDLQIMKDTDLHYRVHDVSIDPFNTAIVSNNLKTIGGYHAAKLQRYQDIIERHLRAGNMNVLNILNAKYFIVKGSDGKLQAQLNPNARGNAWAVKNIQWAKDADEELNALENFAPENTVVIDERFKPELNSQQLMMAMPK